MQFPEQRSRYQVERRLGEGGRGEVFRAYDRVLRRWVALKRFASTGEGTSPEEAWQEGIHLAAVQHPNVVSVYDCGADEAGPFLVMELVEGETLEEVVVRGAFPLRDFRILAQQSLEGLAAAHQASLLHRDLKPGNLMLKHGPTNDLQVKLMDFGIAGFTAPAFGDVLPAASDKPGTILGTVEFMAPEQFEGRPVSARSELYSMGCIFYYALTAQDPFLGENMEAIVTAHLAAEVVPLAGVRPDLPRSLCDWVMRLLGRHPEDRPASAVEALLIFYGIFADLAAP